MQHPIYGSDEQTPLPLPGSKTTSPGTSRSSKSNFSKLTSSVVVPPDGLTASQPPFKQKLTLNKAMPRLVSRFSSKMSFAPLKFSESNQSALMGHPSLALQDAGVPRNQHPALNLNDLKHGNKLIYLGPRATKKDKRVLHGVCLGLVVLLTLGGLTAGITVGVFGVGKGLEGNDGEDGGNDLPSLGFCGTLERDNEIRQMFLDELRAVPDTTITDTFSLGPSLNLDCLPPGVLGFVKETEDLNLLNAILILELLLPELRTVSADAFNSPDTDLLLEPTLLFVNELRIRETELETFPEGFFRGFTEVSRLDLARNNLKNLSLDTFDGHTSMEFIDLSQNSQMVVLPAALKSLLRVDKLRLEANSNLTTISNSFFSGMILQRLEMEGTPIADEENLAEFRNRTGVDPGAEVTGFVLF